MVARAAVSRPVVARAAEGRPDLRAAPSSSRQSSARRIKTVGIVTWSTNLAGLTSAKIDFGLDTKYGMTAPVGKPVAGDNTTLLLGMKPTVSSSSPRTYHYQITATGTAGDCVSPDYTITTGALVDTGSQITVAAKSTASATYGWLRAHGK